MYYIAFWRSSSSVTHEELTNLDKDWILVDNEEESKVIDPHLWIDAAITIQKFTRTWIVRMKVSEIKRLNEKCKKVISTYDEKIEKLSQGILTETANQESLEKERVSIGAGFKEFGHKVKLIFTEQEKSPKEKLEEASRQSQNRIVELLNQLKELEEQKEKEIKAINDKIQGIFAKMVPESPPPVKKDERTPYAKMLEDIATHTHEDLKKLIEVIFGKMEEGIVKEWEFDENGSFKIGLQRAAKLWICPQFEDGKLDPRTPKGVVLLVGGDETYEVHGRVGNGVPEIYFDKGFGTFCHYRKKVWGVSMKGCADGQIKCLKYDEKKQTVAIKTSNTARKVNYTVTSTEDSKIGSLIKTWEKGKVIEGCHEAYLNDLHSLKK